jgi:hypothetical protein
MPRSWVVLLALRHRQKRPALPPLVDRWSGRAHPRDDPYGRSRRTAVNLSEILQAFN